MAGNIILGDREQVLFQSRFSLMRFTREWAITILACAGSLAALAELDSGGGRLRFAEPTRHMLQSVLEIVAIAAFLLFLLGFALYRQRRIVLTTNRLVITSLWNLHSSNIVLRNIRNIEKRRTIVGLMFGYGTLEVQDSDDQWVALPFVPRVDRLEAMLANASMQPRSD